VFNEKGQLCKHTRTTYLETVENLCEIHRDIKVSKEGLFIVIPLVKKHLFGNPEYNLVDFVTINTQTM
jgi:hypothetical protein